MVRRRALKTDHLKLFIIHEPEELVDGIFLTNIQKIIKELPGDTEIALFAALRPHGGLKKHFMRNP